MKMLEVVIKSGDKIIDRAEIEFNIAYAMSHIGALLSKNGAPKLNLIAEVRATDSHIVTVKMQTEVISLLEFKNLKELKDLKDGVCLGIYQNKRNKIITSDILVVDNGDIYFEEIEGQKLLGYIQ